MREWPQQLKGGAVEHFGERLRRLRGDRPQKSVAEALEIPQTTLSSLEKQQTIPRGEILTKLADFFGIPIDYFYEVPEPESTESAKEWLNHLRGDLKGRNTIAAHSRDLIGRSDKEKIAQRIKKKYDETSNKNQ
jgi:transcriptional regulator with XRE-family HTH domain